MPALETSPARGKSPAPGGAGPGQARAQADSRTPERATGAGVRRRTGHAALPLPGSPGEAASLGPCRSLPGRILEPESLKDLALSANASVGLSHCKSPNLCNQKTPIQLCRALNMLL